MDAVGIPVVRGDVVGLHKRRQIDGGGTEVVGGAAAFGPARALVGVTLAIGLIGFGGEVHRMVDDVDRLAAARTGVPWP